MKTYKSNICQYSLKKNEVEIKKVKISCSKDAADYIRGFYHDDIGIYESFYMLLLNNANNTMGYVKISQGGITGTLVDVRIMLKYAIEALATSVIIAHNHPSGNRNPSEADKQLTKKVKIAMEQCDIKVLDHIIIVPDNGDYFSFGDEGLF